MRVMLAGDRRRAPQRSCTDRPSTGHRPATRMPRGASPRARWIAPPTPTVTMDGNVSAPRGEPPMTPPVTHAPKQPTGQVPVTPRPDVEAASARTSTKTDSLRDLVERGDFAAAQDWARTRQVWEVVDEIDRMRPVDAVAAFRLLDPERAFDVFEDLEPNGQQAILEVMRGAEFSEFVDSLDPDDRARMLHELPAKVARRVLAGLSPEERALTATLLGYP